MINKTVAAAPASVNRQFGVAVMPAQGGGGDFLGG